HHARGASILIGADGEAYREAFAFDHPDDNPEAAELGILGFHGSYYFLWPMLRPVITASRAVGVHARARVTRLREAFPEVAIGPVGLGMGREVPIDDGRRIATRAALGLASDALLFGVFGGLTADKRVPQIVGALARLRTMEPRAHLLLAGAQDPAL